MTGIEHSIIATAVCAAFYYFGKHVDKKEMIEDAIARTLDTLEQNNFIICKTDGDGQKVLQEVIEKPKGL